MQAGILSVQRLFDREVHYAVPLYQRPYVWNEADQWQPLWDDLCPLAEMVADGKEGRAHFLGASVQEVIPVAAGTTETRRIIDGQQRMTTLQLLLKAFQDVAVGRGLENYGKAVATLLVNSDPLIVEPPKKRKLWPTRADQHDYQCVMDSNSPAQLREALGLADRAYPLENHNIANAYLFFFKEIDAWLGSEQDKAEARLRGLYGAIRDRLRIVVIDLDQQDDAQAIFETLNARGAPLLSADLVKNSLLGQLPDLEAEEAYRRYWQSFDANGAFWRKLTGRGHAQRARIETFLQHALTLMTGESVSAGHLYNAYRDYAALDEAGSAIDLLARFKRLGDIYFRLQHTHKDQRVSEFFYRLNVLDVVTAWPFILALYEKYEVQPQIIKDVLIDLESYLVRRMTCRLSSRGYGVIFTKLAGLVKTVDTDIVKAVRNELLAGQAEADRFPSDTEFRKYWTTAPLYQNLTRPRIRLLLEAVEEAARSTFAEDARAPKNLTVEHVMPQGWRQSWPLPDNIRAEDRDTIVHTIGNLTLLNGRFNTFQSNRPWIAADDSQPEKAIEDGKRENLRRHTVLALNRQLCESDVWSETEIAARAEVLFQQAKQIWNRPNL
jgi:uncharacterized protein with ParB-like and HNH nuclease domain